MILYFLILLISCDTYVDLLGTVATIKGSGQITQSVVRTSSYTTFSQIIISLEPSSIGSGAFQDCSGTKSLYISESILSIDFGKGSTFRFMKNLEKIEVSPSNPSYSSDEQGILYNIDKTILYRAPNLEKINIPSTVNTLSEQCFQGNSRFKSLLIPKSVNSIRSGFLYDVDHRPDNLTFESGSTITEFVSSSFSYQKFKKIVIPKSVKVIRQSAFQYASVEELLFEEGSLLETIEKNCFYLSSMSEIEFPSNLKSINEASFKSCNKLTTVSIPKSTTYIHPDAFSGCTMLTSITIDPNNQNYSIIDGILFSKDKKMLLIAPAAVKSIPIPAETEEIGKTAIQGCKLATDISLDPNNKNFSQLNGVLYTKGFIEAVAVVGGCTSVQFHTDCTKIGDYAMYGCDLAVSISFGGDKVTEIGAFAFYNCKGFSKLDLKNVRNIYTNAFGSVKNLISVTFSGQKLESIDSYAFSGSSVEEIYIPNTVTSIGMEILRYSECRVFDIPIDCKIKSINAQAFAYANKLQSIRIPSNLESIPNDCFLSATQLTNVDFSHAAKLINIYDSAFINSPISGIVTFPVQLKMIDSNAFKGCNKVTKFVFPDGCLVNSIKGSCFAYCTSITSFEFPEHVTSLNPSILEGCTGLTEIKLNPNNKNYVVEDGILYDTNWALVIYPPGRSVGVLSSNIAKITQNVFYRQNVLTNITFKADSYQLTTLSSNTFVECDNLQEIVFPKLLNSIDSAAISKCPAIRRLCFAAGSKLQRLSESLFSGLTNIQEVEFGRNSQLSSIGARCFFGCTSLRSFIAPTTITSIETSSFEGCKSLSVFDFVVGDLPQTSIITVSDRSFFGCKSLSRFNFQIVSTIGSESFMGSGISSANFTDTLTAIGDSAFSGCSGLSFVSYCGTKDIAGVGFDLNVIVNVRFTFNGQFSNCYPVKSLDSSCVYHPPPTAYPVCLSPAECILVDLLPCDDENV